MGTEGALTVLILCTGNSCRSQMADGWWRQLGGPAWRVHSAGSHPAGYVHPLAIRVMAEADVDISANRSKHVREFLAEDIDLVVTVCDHARESCPVLPGAKQLLHWPFDDPVHTIGSEAKRLDAFRKTRDLIRERIKSYLASHTGAG